MPAEWEPHEATWLTWPQNEITWPGKRLAVVRDTYLQMLEGLLPNEKVHLLLRDDQVQQEVLRFLKPKLNIQNLMIHQAPVVDSWVRDYGPTFVKKGKEKAWCKWIFNAWGGKYTDLMEDTHIFNPDSGLVSESCFDSKFILEGGSIEVNGKGTCLTTEQCLLNKNRNSSLSREEIEEKLRNYLGVSHILWLKEGIVGDDTDGHIDDITRFVDAQTVVTAFEEDESDENYLLLKENLDRLKNMTDQDGKKLKVIKLPMPGIVADEGVRLPASYANFLIANEVVLLPVYGNVKQDDRAIKILKEIYPKREILPISCNDLVYGLGAIHCVSQQEPS